MSLHQIRFFRADCDVRLDRVTGKPLEPQPGRDAYLAWSDAGAAAAGPEWEALGGPCPTNSGRIDAPTPAVARRQLMNAGWKVVPRLRRQAPQVACPDHREHLLRH